MSRIQYEQRGPTALLTLNHPPVNGLGAAVRQGLLEALDRALADPSVKAVVITGSDRAFSGGADVKEFGTPLALREPRLPVVIAALEASPKPVIAAIRGVCLGGGLELALGAHFRVARGDAQIALPEVKLGLLPGAGGTQRLPRAIGLEAALNMIVSGSMVPAARLAGTALFDAVVDDDPVAAALLLAEQVVADGRPLKRLRDIQLDAAQGEAFIQFARKTIAATAGPYPAPLKCVDAVALCLSQPFDDALRQERELFLGLLGSAEARALRHVFNAERAAGKPPALPADVAAPPIQTVGVVGAGTMGSGIAMSLLDAGRPVTLIETSQAALDMGLATIRRHYESQAAKGKLKPELVEQRLARLTPTLDFQRLHDADLVVEAVFEDMDVKRQVLAQLDAVCKPGAILASNTSYLDIDALAATTQRPQDVIGLHFFSPAHVMRLLEVVRGKATSAVVLARSLALARSLKKVAVVAGVCDGFIGNRMLARYGAAAAGLVNAGATPQQVDRVLQAFGLAMGPFRVGDLAGLDIGWATRKRRAAAAGVPLQASIADRLCEAGRFGQKTGAGWYRYEAGQRTPLPDPVTEGIVTAFRHDQGLTPRRVDDAEVVERCIYALVNEGARILEEGIAERASDIDIVYLNGYGFPRHRGGPMLYADTVGLPSVVRALRRFAAEPGAEAWWHPAPLLLKLASEGQTFN